MMIIRSGITRTVLLAGRWAVKIPSARGVHPGGVRGRLASLAQGLLANQSEHTWSRYDQWQGQVAPVLRSWLLGIVQVYPRCDPLDPVYEAAWAAGFTSTRPRLHPDPGDEKPDAYGMLAGRVVRLDYAL